VRTYETLFIINPDLEESETNKTIETIQDTITTSGGTIVKVDKWGKQQLAYQIQKKREGYYVLIYFEAPSPLINELYRRYKLTDPIMRYLVVQLTKPQVEDLLHPTDSVKPREFSVLPSYDDEYNQEDDFRDSED
jgi:small subunit ribosomal protein S6